MSMNDPYALERVQQQIKHHWQDLSLHERVKIMSLLEQLELQYQKMADLSYRNCGQTDDH